MVLVFKEFAFVNKDIQEVIANSNHVIKFAIKIMELAIF